MFKRYFYQHVNASEVGLFFYSEWAIFATPMSSTSRIHNQLTINSKSMSPIGLISYILCKIDFLGHSPNELANLKFEIGLGIEPSPLERWIMVEEDALE